MDRTPDLRGRDLFEDSEEKVKRKVMFDFLPFLSWLFKKKGKKSESKKP